MYRYDSLGRVVREDNEPLGFTFLYIYNINGNLDIVKRFKYTVSTPQTPLEAINYIYEAGRPDRLVKLVSSINGELAISSYDSAGNPRAYKGAALAWNKNGTLKTYVKGTQSLSFRYDASGIRQEKTVSGVEHNYTTFGSRILGEQYSGHNLSYYYDATGICGLRHNGLASYYFQKNIQGDVVRILDATGAVVARYDYDAWGNHKIYAKVNGNYIDITTNSLYNNHIARINPFRYRGYYFDVETGWYYLESRYYDPSLRRFISADDPAVAVSAQSGTFGGLNPYAYCLNDPVNMADPTGNIAGWIIFGFIMAFIGLIFAIPAFVDSWHAFAKEPSWSNLGVALLATVDLVLAIIDFTQAFKAVYAAVKASKLLSAQIANPDVYKVKVGKSADEAVSSAVQPNLDGGYSPNGYNPKLGERTFEGYVRQNADPEISLYTKSADFNNSNGKIGGAFKRFGAESHGGLSPHVHQPVRNIAPNGTIYGKVGKTVGIDTLSPGPKDAKQLYEYLNNGKYHK